MIPYWVIYIIILALSILDFLGLKFSKEARSSLLAAAVLLLILFSGLRFESDNDYATYADIYERAPGLGDIFKGRAELSDVYGEFLFGLLCILLKTFNLPTYVLFVVMSFITFYALHKAILSFSTYPFTVLLLYVSMHFLAGGFTQIRFGLATTLSWMAFSYLYNGRTKRYFLYLLLACLFHISALIGLTVYFFRSFRLNTYIVYGAVLVSCIISFLDLSGLMISAIATAISDLRYASYLDKSELLSKTNNFSILLYGVVTIIFWHCRIYYADVRSKKLFDFLLRVAVLCLISSAFFIQLYIISRIALLLQMVFIFIIPMIVCLPRVRYYVYFTVWVYATFRYQQFFTVDPDIRYIHDYQNVLFLDSE